MGTIGCKVSTSVYYISESISQWLLVAFCVERVIAIYWPLKAKSLLGNKTSLSLIFGVIVISILACIPAPFAFHESESPDGTVLCNMIGISIELTYLMVFFTTAQKYPISTMFIIILSFILGIKLLGLQRQRAESFDPGSKTVSNTSGSVDTVKYGKNKELHAAVILLLMSSVHGSIYVAESVCWEVIYINNIFNFISPIVFVVLLKVGLMADVSSLIVRLWNFYLYFIKIPSFRSAIFHILCLRK